MPEADPLICEPRGSGLFLPLFGNAEQHWDMRLRSVLYLCGLLWSFMGVAIVADVFMAGIETITSQKKEVKIMHNGKEKKMRVVIWNATVANLTLMALGSSAPEILLSCIELMSNDYYSGDLGPSTIVGSAAFNLLCITAVCIVAIPDDQTRVIKDTGVFAITGFFSVFAYVWLVVILIVISPNVVEVWEGVVTFLYFPLLVILAYLADTGYFGTKDTPENAHMLNSIEAADGTIISAADVAKIIKKIKSEYGIEFNKLTEAQIAELVSQEAGKMVPKSRAYYRVNATRQMTGGRKVIAEDKGSKDGYKKLVDVESGGGDGAPDVEMQWSAKAYSIKEGDGKVNVTVVRTGLKNIPCSVKYATRDKTAKGGEDYVEASGTLHFAVNEESKSVEISIIDDDKYEDDETFEVVLSSPSCAKKIDIVEFHKVCTVTIINDDMPGKLGFAGMSPDGAMDTIKVRESDPKGAMIVVNRVDGCSGTINVEYFTEDNTAIAGKDYMAVTGTLTFLNGETTKTVPVPVIDDHTYDEKNEKFYFKLANPTDGATLLTTNDGDTLFAEVEILNDETAKKGVDNVIGQFEGKVVNTDKLSIGSAHYSEQFMHALLVNGGEDGEVSCGDRITHIVSLPWKLLFACIPPTDFGGGWVCFIVALIFIGNVTALIGDLAGLLGCSISMPDAITAITFVALGTSLPDTFASMASAVGDEYADASIGNVTGSNSVNVFLGLGLPWMIGALVWQSADTTRQLAWQEKYRNDLPDMIATYPNGAFSVPAGDLGYSVGVFTVCACTCLGGLVLRRKVVGAELGGPPAIKYLSAIFFVCLWFTYIILSAMKSLETLAAKEAAEAARAALRW